MGKGHRPARLGEEIKKIISSMLLTELKDPRLQGEMVSITGVEVTADGSYAKVFFTALALASGDDRQEQAERADKAQREADVLAALQSAKGRIKREIGRQIKLRHVPELLFQLDTSMEYGRHMEEVLRGLNR